MTLEIFKRKTELANQCNNIEHSMKSNGKKKYLEFIKQYINCTVEPHKQLSVMTTLLLLLLPSEEKANFDLFTIILTWP